MEIVISLVIGLVIYIVSKAAKAKEEAAKNVIKSRRMETNQDDFEPEFEPQPAHITFKSESENTTSFYSVERDSNLVTPPSENNEEVNRHDIGSSVDKTSDILKDFDPVKAMVYSEIMKPKYID